MKSRAVQSLFISIGMLIASIAHAQRNYAEPTLPAACDQYFKAADACMINAIRYYERVDVRAAGQWREFLAEMGKVENAIHREVATAGEAAVAERCTRPQFVNGMVNSLTGLILTLASAHALDDDCASASSDLQLPQQ